MSPGLRSRPSLSGQLSMIRREETFLARVAGTTVPAFVERAFGYVHLCLRLQVSPGLRSRPSLSADAVNVTLLRSTPSVAGTTVPAFVERRRVRMKRLVRARSWCRRDYGPGLR